MQTHQTATADYPPLLTLERDRLLQLLGTVEEQAWAWPTPCPAWDVAGLCRHLLGDDFHALSRMRDGYSGTIPPPDVDENGLIGWLDELQKGWVDAARRMSPRLVIQLLEWMGPQVAAAFARADPRAVTQHVSWASDQPVPMWLDIAREVTEYWVHRQQLLDALGSPPDPRVDLLGPVLDALRWAYPYRLEGARAETGDTVGIDIDGSLQRHWLVVRRSQGWRFADDAGRRFVGRIRLTTDQAWRLLTNNLPARDQAELDIEGSDEITAILRRTRAIIGSPEAGHP